MALVSAVINEARVILQDLQDLPYRYSDSELLYTYNLAIKTVKRLRPDLFIGSFGAPLADAVSTDTFPLPPEYEGTVAQLIVARAEMRDDEFAVDNRAAILLTLAKSELQG